MPVELQDRKAAPRKASRPSAGGMRVGLDVAIATVLVSLISEEVPGDMLPHIQALVVAVVSGILAYAGKVLRDKNMRIGQLL